MTLTIKQDKETVVTVYGCSIEVVEHLINKIDKDIYTVFIGE